MSNFDSDYIVKLLGSCLLDEPYFLILELMEEGALLGFLRTSRPTKVSQPFFPIANGHLAIVSLLLGQFESLNGPF